MKRKPDSHTDPHPRHGDFFRRSWWRGNEAWSPADSRRWSERLREHRPPWWPENEEWPPRDRRHWRRMGRHNPFFRRLGCLFLVFNLVSFAVFAGILGFVLNAFGVIRFSFNQVQWVRPFAIIFAVFVLVMIVRVALNVRRMSVPLDDLLDASEQVASGDFSARVERRIGPPEIRSLIDGFNSMAEQLQINDQQRRAMLADVSHELRTPLTIIQGNVEGILDGMYPADEARLKSIVEETQVLSRLVDDLRTLSLAESGSLELKREPTDFAALIRETVAVFDSQADEAGVKIETSLALNELSLEIDPERIRQVLTNLLANALRYTPRGEKIKVSLVESANGVERRALVSVEDRGPGIASSDLPHVFDRFYKSADSRGMGLGLSIAQYIVEAHGGEIKAESEAGRGTKISFSVPL